MNAPSSEKWDRPRGDAAGPRRPGARERGLALLRCQRVGVGAGVWHANDKNRYDLVIIGGIRIYGDPDGFNVSLFGEARNAFDEFHDADRYARIGGGLRFQF